MSRVSVIIPSYNRARTLPETIGSVLAQTHRDFEVIVVDDESTDDTADVVAAIGGVSYERIVHGGVCAARNRGIEASSGSYLLFLDSDDILYDTALEELARVLDRYPNCGAAYCGFVITDGPNVVRSKSALDRPSGDVFRRMCMEHLCIVHSVMVRREIIDISGGFDERLRQFEDLDFWIRVSAATQFVFVPKHLVEYRRWTTGGSELGDYYVLAGEIVIGNLSHYHRTGRLNKAEWDAVLHRFRGHHRDVYTALAFKSYWAGDWRAAYAYALKGFSHDPKSILNRGVWALLARSALRAGKREG